MQQAKHTFSAGIPQDRRSLTCSSCWCTAKRKMEFLGICPHVGDQKRAENPIVPLLPWKAFPISRRQIHQATTQGYPCTNLPFPITSSLLSLIQWMMKTSLQRGLPGIEMAHLWPTNGSDLFYVLKMLELALTMLSPWPKTDTLLWTFWMKGEGHNQSCDCSKRDAEVSTASLCPQSGPKVLLGIWNALQGGNQVHGKSGTGGWPGIHKSAK